MRCPAPGHADKNASVSFHADEERILITCHRGCSTESILTALHLEMADLFRDRNGATPDPLPFGARKGKAGDGGGTLVDIYRYTDGAGTVLAEKGRFELDEKELSGKPKKTFKWRLPGADGWRGTDGLPMSAMALYGAEDVLHAPGGQTVYYVEGERAAEACRAAGLLAVTHAGGASTREFGDALEVLRGRKVALWPDNDGAGREYMAAVHARLNGVAAEIRVVAVPLPVKGDAVEWFGGGGTVAQLEAGALLVDGPSVEYHGADHIIITMPLPGLGAVRFDFDEIEKSRHELECELGITVEMPGVSRTPHNDRINLLSPTTKTNLRRELQEIYGKTVPWAALLNEVFALARARFLAYDRSVDVFDSQPITESDLFFHHPLIPKDHITILFGDRASTKSYIAAEIAFCAAIGEPFLNWRMPMGPVLFGDYEDSEGNFRRRIDRIAAGLGLALMPDMIHYLNLMGLPLADMRKTIKKKLVDSGCVLFVVDSAGPATGGRPEEAERAITFMEALRTLGVTVLVIAHVPKNHGPAQPEDPFGSSFYSNLSRRTWYVQRVQEEASDVVDVGLYCKKVNDGPTPRPVALRVTFEGLSGPVTIKRADMQDTPALQAKRPLRYRIWDALATPRTVASLVSVMDPAGEEGKALANSIDHALRNRPGDFLIVGHEIAENGGRPATVWGRVAREHA